MKTLTSEQLDKLKVFAVEALKGMNFYPSWIESLEKDFNEKNDCTFNAFDLARYISWHMRSNGIHIDNIAFATQCAFEAVLFGANEIIALDNDIEENSDQYWKQLEF